MSEHAHTEDYRGLWWEWLSARLVFVLGFGIPIAAIGTVIFMGGLRGGQTTAPTREVAGLEFCQATVSLAQSYGIVPNFAKAQGQPQTSDVRGRYVCTAATTTSKYLVAVDLICRNITDSRCYNLFSVSQGDGTVIFQRQN
jgi:hypothetical protein